MGLDGLRGLDDFVVGFLRISLRNARISQGCRSGKKGVRLQPIFWYSLGRTKSQSLK